MQEQGRQKYVKKTLRYYYLGIVNKEKKIKANVAETEQARGITWYKDQTIRTLSNVYNLFGFKSKYTGKSFKGIK